MDINLHSGIADIAVVKARVKARVLSTLSRDSDNIDTADAHCCSRSLEMMKSHFDSSIAMCRIRPRTKFSGSHPGKFENTDRDLVDLTSIL